MNKHQTTTLPCWALSRLAVFSAILLTAILLAACGATPAASGTPSTITATASPLSAPTSVIVLRLGGFGEQTRVAPFQMTTHDTARVMQLYQAVYALPPYPPDRISCALDQGVGYELSFMHGETLVLQVVMDDACRLILISSPPAPLCRDWIPAFTAQITATVGTSVTTIDPPSGLYHTAGPNGPFAQGAPTPPVFTHKRC